MPTVLITGAARRIGKGITTHMAAEGWDVVAGVRNEADATAISALPRVSAIQLDVTEDLQLAALAKVLPTRLDAVVNNAGILVGGLLEMVSAADLRRQLDVNVVGQLAVTQAVLPRLRASRGRIVFMSSVNGRVATPMTGSYCASKFALEAAADALRMEVKPMGIRVSVIEPAQVDTEVWDSVEGTVAELDAVMSADQPALYAEHLAGFEKSIPKSRKIADPPEKVATVVHEALTARRPKARYPVGIGPRLQLPILNVLPSAVTDVLLRKLFGQP